MRRPFALSLMLIACGSPDQSVGALADETGGGSDGGSNQPQGELNPSACQLTPGFNLSDFGDTFEPRFGRLGAQTEGLRIEGILQDSNPPRAWFYEMWPEPGYPDTYNYLGEGPQLNTDEMTGENFAFAHRASQLDFVNQSFVNNTNPTVHRLSRRLMDGGEVVWNYDLPVNTGPVRWDELSNGDFIVQHWEAEPNDTITNYIRRINGDSGSEQWSMMWPETPANTAGALEVLDVGDMHLLYRKRVTADGADLLLAEFDVSTGAPNFEQVADSFEDADFTFNVDTRPNGSWIAAISSLDLEGWRVTIHEGDESTNDGTSHSRGMSFILPAGAQPAPNWVYLADGSVFASGTYAPGDGTPLGTWTAVVDKDSWQLRCLDIQETADAEVLDVARWPGSGSGAVLRRAGPNATAVLSSLGQP